MNFLGAPYPITKTARGLLFSQNGVNQVKADLLQLLLTNPGERVMLPQFGTPLRDLVFDPSDDVLVEKAKDMIIKSIDMWEPRVTIQDIQVYTNFDQDLNPDDLRIDIEHILGIRILFFDPENISEIQTLTLEVPLAQGA